MNEKVCESEYTALPEEDQFLQIRSESVHIPQAGEILMTKIPSHGLSRWGAEFVSSREMSLAPS